MPKRKNNLRFIVLTSFSLSLIFTAAPFLVSAESPTNFVFVSPLQTIQPGTTSAPITLQAQNSSGNSLNLPQTGCLLLKSTSSQGQFSSSISSWTAVSVLTMSKGTANRSFYYKDDAAGTYTLSVQAVLRPDTETLSCANWPVAEWPSGWNASQSISINGSGTTSSTTPSNSSSDSSSATTTTDSNSNSSTAQGNTSSFPVEPQIFSKIIAPAMAIAGADIILRGDAVGLEKKPLTNPRFLWNFGDGATAEGESVLHAYNFPGDYVVILDVSSGKFSATSRFQLKVIAANVTISGVVAGPDGRIDLVNNSSQELDLSWWRIRSANQFFTLPKDTRVLPHITLPLSSAVTGLNVNPQDLALLYPNGSVAFSQESSDVAAAPIAPVLPVLPEVKTPKDDSAAKIVSLAVAQKSSDASKAVAAPSQMAAVSQADEPSSTEAVSQSAAKNGQLPSSLWLYGVLGVIILALGFVLLPKPAADIEAKNPADDITIMED